VQIDRFARSLLARAHGEPTPDDGYPGEYVDEIAAAIVAKVPGVLDLPRDDAQEVFRREGVPIMFDEVKTSLVAFRVDFDVYFLESSLHESGAVDKLVQQLKDVGKIYFADGAWWLNSSEYGDDKDRVVIKSDGRPAYIAADIAYAADKRARGFDLCIYLLGADHHGYIGRLKAGAAALGDDPSAFEVLIGQIVRLVKDGQPVRMGKRTGNVITMDDLVEAVGVDAARYSLERGAIDSALDVDVDVLVKRTNDNPVYYVQYAHARLSSLQRNAAALGIARTAEPDLALLTHEREADLLGALGEFPRIVASASRATGPAPYPALPRGPRRHLPPLLRRVPGAAPGRRAGHPAHRRPAVAVRSNPSSARQRASHARRNRSRADVTQMTEPSRGRPNHQAMSARAKSPAAATRPATKERCGSPLDPELASGSTRRFAQGGIRS